MPFFFFVELSVKMKREEKLSFALCDRWKKRSVAQNILVQHFSSFLRPSSNRGLFYASDSRLEDVRQKTSSLYFVE